MPTLTAVYDARALTPFREIPEPIRELIRRVFPWSPTKLAAHAFRFVPELLDWIAVDQTPDDAEVVRVYLTRSPDPLAPGTLTTSWAFRGLTEPPPPGAVRCLGVFDRAAGGPFPVSLTRKEGR